ncbi:MAG: thiamine-phosphate synthase family protein [Nitrososphaerales archaeon]
MMVEYFLPNIRGLVAHELHERGESQRKIATLLGITQARVSHYLSNKKQKYMVELSKQFGSTQSEILGYAKILSEDVSRSQVDGIFTLYSIWKSLLFRGDVCAVHRSKSGVSAECSVCMELHRPLRESETNPETENALILRDISEAISMLENSATFPLMMPEVSVNLAMSRSNPRTARDVAAVPGRINKIHGRAKAFVPPEFGSSNHMSKVLLIFSSKSSVLRAAMNLRYDPDIDAALVNLGIERVFTSDTHGSEEKPFADRQGSIGQGDPVLKRLVSVSVPASAPSVFAAIDKGSEGVEPNTYLIGGRASELAQVALKISHNYSTALRATPKST